MRPILPFLRTVSLLLLGAALVGCSPGTEPSLEGPAASTPATATAAPDATATAAPTATVVPTSELGPSDVVLVWELFGGCSDAEPRWCPRWSVRRDGSVTVQLPREFDSDRINGTGSVDTALVENWIEVAAATDFATLADRVGPGPCTADFDGIDVRATFPWLDLTLTECKLAFDESDPFFEALVPLGRTAEKAAPWDLDRYVADNPLPTPIPPPPAPPTATEVADSTD